MSSNSSGETKKIIILAESGVVADVLVPYAVSKAAEFKNIELSKIYAKEQDRVTSPAEMIQKIVQPRSRIGSFLRFIQGKKSFTTIPFSIRLIVENVIDTEVEYINCSYNSPEFIAELQAEKPDYLLLIGCQEILDGEVIQSVNEEVINFHWSKLPSYRGRNATFWPVYNNEAETGVTFHSITEEIDQGYVLLQKSIPITESDDRHSISYKSLQTGKEALTELLYKLNINELERDLEITGGEYYSQEDFETIRFDPLETARENINRLSAKGELMIKFTDGTNLLATELAISPKPTPENVSQGEVIDVDRYGIHIIVDDDVVTVTKCYHLPSIIIAYLKSIKTGVIVQNALVN